MENWDTLKATKMMEAASFIRTLMESKSRLSDSQGHLLILIQPPDFTAPAECLKAAIHVFCKHDTNQVNDSQINPTSRRARLLLDAIEILRYEK